MTRAISPKRRESSPRRRSPARKRRPSKSPRCGLSSTDKGKEYERRWRSKSLGHASGGGRERDSRREHRERAGDRERIADRERIGDREVDGYRQTSDRADRRGDGSRRYADRKDGDHRDSDHRNAEGRGSGRAPTYARSSHREGGDRRQEPHAATRERQRDYGVPSRTAGNYASAALPRRVYDQRRMHDIRADPGRERYSRDGGMMGTVHPDRRFGMGGARRMPMMRREPSPEHWKHDKFSEEQEEPPVQETFVARMRYPIRTKLVKLDAETFEEAIGKGAAQPDEVEDAKKNEETTVKTAEPAEETDHS